jgi:glycine cleavage system H protein
MNVAGFEFPDGLHYLVDEQVWARFEGDGTATVGITALGMHLAGEVYMCRPKSPGSVVEQGRGIAVVELAKSIVSVKSPVGGEVIAINGRLAQEPALLNADPYGEGWLARLRPADAAADARALVHGVEAAPAMRRHAWLQGLGDPP